jgi:hypothetical protein
VSISSLSPASFSFKPNNAAVLSFVKCGRTSDESA